MSCIRLPALAPGDGHHRRAELGRSDDSSHRRTARKRAARACPRGFGRRHAEQGPYVTHFVFRPVMTLDVPDLGSAT